ncbi:MAG: IPT/TIG domain-containing protein [Acidobacteriota bacterium]|nr:IPT/TIG domain-containing protein [Acidobacteriota bacterium]
MRPRLQRLALILFVALSARCAFSQSPVITSVSPTTGVAGLTQVTITGSGFGAGSGAVGLGTNFATVNSWTDTQIVATVGSASFSGLAYVVTANQAWSNSVDFTVIRPTITNISPSTVVAGGQVTITGSGFGASQGDVALGTNFGTVNSWSDTQIVATIGSAAAAGSAYVVTANQAWSNSLPFTVVMPPAITASLSPAANSSGWNNSLVTVSFSCTAGTLPIANCPAPQTVSTEGAAQAVTGTVSDTAGDQVTATVSVNIDMTPPVIAVSAPADQSTVSQAAVTITGSATDALAGTTQVTCGGVTGTVSDPAFSCGVTLNVGLSLIVVKATDAAGNVSALRLHLNLAGTLSAPNTLTVTPSGVNMLVGGTQQFTAVDELGRPRTDATWTVSDTTIATITSDSSPLMTGVAAGQATLTATVGSVSGQTTVNVLSGTSLPDGTLQWSAPPPPSYTAQQILQAEPSTGSPDIYTVATAGGNCMVTGLTGGGQPLWTTPLAVSSCKGTPDGSGGILVNAGNQVIDLDGQTGTPAWTTAIAPDHYFLQEDGLTVGQDGTIYFTSWWNANTFGLVSLAADTGIGKLLYTPPQGEQITPSCGRYSRYDNIVTDMTNQVIGPDGTLFAGMFVSDNIYDPCMEGTFGAVYTLSLLQIGPNGSTTVTPIKVDNNTNDWYYLPLAVIPDGQGGALFAWSFAQGENYPFQGHITDVTSSGSTDVSVPGTIYGTPYEMVLGENGLAFANNGNTITAFNITSGSTAWTYATQDALSIVAATGDGGVIINDFVQGLLTLDANGSPGSATPAPSNAEPWTSGEWLVNVNDTLPGMSGGPLAYLAANAWIFPDGSRAGSNSSPRLTTATFIVKAPSTNGQDTNFGSTGAASTYIGAGLNAHTRWFVDTGQSLANIGSFVVQNVSEVNDVVGFIGDSYIVGCGSQNPYCWASVGLGFTDNWLVRTPDCSASGNAAGLCWGIDDVQYPLPCGPNGVQSQGFCYYQTPPSQVGATQVGNNCYRFNIFPYNKVPIITPALLTSAKVIFIAACDTTNFFNGWWNMNLNGVAGGGALVVPDIAAMANLVINQQNVLPNWPQNMGSVDLVQGTVAYKAFVKSLAAGNTAQVAVNAANTAVAAFYPTIVYSDPLVGSLPQVVYKVADGTNPNVCPACR